MVFKWFFLYYETLSHLGESHLTHFGVMFDWNKVVSQYARKGVGVGGAWLKGVRKALS